MSKTISVSDPGSIVYTEDAQGIVYTYVVADDGSLQLKRGVDLPLTLAAARMAEDLSFTLGVKADWCTQDQMHVEHYRINAGRREWCGGTGNTPEQDQ